MGTHSKGISLPILVSDNQMFVAQGQCRQRLVAEAGAQQQNVVMEVFQSREGRLLLIRPNMMPKG
jgi:hypothetical protein